jgi:hypothetical protein
LWEEEGMRGVIPLVLTTDKNVYSRSENVEFILSNVGKNVSIIFDSNLEEALQIFDPFGNTVVMRPPADSDGLISISPGESINWVWDQTYYLWVYEEPGGMPTWSYLTGTQVWIPDHPRSNFTARVTFGPFEDEVKFSIME